MHGLPFTLLQLSATGPRRLVRSSIAKACSSYTSVARPLEAASELPFVRDLAESFGFARCEAELQERKVSFGTLLVHFDS